MRLTPLAKVLVGVAAVAVVGTASWMIWGGHGSAPTCKGLLGRPLRVGVVTWPGYAGGIMANNGFKPNKNCDYFQKYNLCVEFLLMEDLDVRKAAFAKGGPDGVDIVWSTVDTTSSEFPGFIQSGVQARSIMQVDWSRGGDAIVADASIKNIEGLAGKKISVTTGSPSQWLLEYNLNNSHLDESQKDWINKNLVGKNASPDALADFVANRVDAAVVWEPDVSAALKNRPGAHILVSSAQARKLIADVMIARADFIKDHPDVIQAFIEGWIGIGTVNANAHPDTVVQLLMDNEPVYKTIGEADTKATLSTVHWATLSDNAEMFNLDGQDPSGVPPLYDRIFDESARTWVKLGAIASPIAAFASKDDSILHKIYSSSPSPRVADVVQKCEDCNNPNKQAIVTKRITVNFPTGSSVLTPAALKVIDEQVSLLPTTFSGAYINVEGNTDDTGSRELNIALSKSRAESVINYLVTRYKLPREQFTPIGNGPDKPVASNATADGKAKNRRTDIALIAR
jgi:NitT/TauT family transport system substrate-binding protein